MDEELLRLASAIGTASILRLVVENAELIPYMLQPGSFGSQDFLEGLEKKSAASADVT